MKELVLTSESPLLRTISMPAIIGVDTERVIKQAREVLNEIYDAKAVSAIQLGYPIRLFVCKYDPFLKEVINPEILSSEGRCTMEEGCLSVPGVFRKIERPETIQVRYQKQTGQEVIQTLTGISARIFQHEFDHLEGKLFIDYPESNFKIKNILITKTG